MRPKVSSDPGCMPVRRYLIWARCVFAVVAAWLMTSCVLLHAEDSKPDEPAQTSATQQNTTKVKDGKTKTATRSDSASCKIKSDDPAVVTHAGEAASPEGNNNQERISGASNEASSGENLTLQAPSREEWTKDQINLGAETASKEESRSEKSGNLKAGSDLKCTSHEAVPKTEPAMPN